MSYIDIFYVILFANRREINIMAVFEYGIGQIPKYL